MCHRWIQHYSSWTLLCDFSWVWPFSAAPSQRSAMKCTHTSPDRNVCLKSRSTLFYFVEGRRALSSNSFLALAHDNSCQEQREDELSIFQISRKELPFLLVYTPAVLMEYPHFGSAWRQRMACWTDAEQMRLTAIHLMKFKLLRYFPQLLKLVYLWITRVLCSLRCESQILRTN